VAISLKKAKVRTGRTNTAQGMTTPIVKEVIRRLETQQFFGNAATAQLSRGLADHYPSDAIAEISGANGVAGTLNNVPLAIPEDAQGTAALVALFVEGILIPYGMGELVDSRGTDKSRQPRTHIKVARDGVVTAPIDSNAIANDSVVYDIKVDRAKNEVELIARPRKIINDNIEIVCWAMDLSQLQTSLVVDHLTGGKLVQYGEKTPHGIQPMRIMV
jgi:hypothetical protein